MTFDLPEGQAEGEPGRFCHMTSVMLRHPYIRYRRGRTQPRLCLCTLCIVGIAETKLEPWKSRPVRPPLVMFCTKWATNPRPKNPWRTNSSPKNPRVTIHGAWHSAPTPTGLLFHGSSFATWDLAGSVAVDASHAYAG